MVVPIVMAYFIDFKVGAEQSHHDVFLTNQQLNTKVRAIILFLESSTDLCSPVLRAMDCETPWPCGDGNI